MSLTDESLAALVRPEVVGLPKYHAGFPADAVRQRYGLNRVAKLNSNENPFGPSPGVAKALEALGTRLAEYPDADCTALRADLGRTLGVGPERITVGNGSENLIELVCRAFLRAGDRVVTLGPSFGLYDVYAHEARATLDKVHVTADMRFDVPAWLAALRAPAKMVLLPNPSNPVGCMLRSADFRVFLEQLTPGTILVVDEAYYEFARHPDYPDSLAELTARDLHWLVLRTFSKAYALAGLRVGYGIASSAGLVGMLDRVRTPFNVNVAAQVAARAALADPEHVRHAVDGIAAERERMRAALVAAGYVVGESWANFLFFDTGVDAEPIAAALMAEGVLVKAWREPGYQRFLRVSIGSRADNDAFLAAFRRVVGRH